MLVQNSRTKTRKNYNDSFIETLVDQDLYYVYGLTNMENGEVGYIGTTYSPNQRYQHHLHDLKSFIDGCYNRQSPAKVKWMAKQYEPPEMKIFAVCMDRKTAEFIERGLIKSFEIEGNYHYWKYRPENDIKHERLFDDDIPFPQEG